MSASNDLAVIWVHYRTPELLFHSVEAMQSEVEAVSTELIVVDNGGLPDRSLKNILASCRIIKNTSNDGYASGINLGVSKTNASHIVVLNPDVIVLPGSVDQLLLALRDFEIVGPSLFLDREMKFRLPINEKRDFVSALLGELAHGSQYWALIARRRWRHHVRSVQKDGTSAVRCYDLSGAILAFTRRAWTSLGPWDAKYRLYFEETDWLNRARKKGLRGGYINSAQIVHLYAQSTKINPEARRWFAQSAQRFEQSNYHPWQRFMLNLSRNWAKTRNWEPSSAQTAMGHQLPVWVELSNSPRGFPAAYAKFDRPMEVEAILGSIPEGQLLKGKYWLRWSDEKRHDLSVMEATVR